MLPSDASESKLVMRKLLCLAQVWARQIFDLIELASGDCLDEAG